MEQPYGPVTFTVDLGNDVTITVTDHTIACENAARLARETGQDVDVIVTFERYGSGYILRHTPGGEVSRLSRLRSGK